MHNAIWNIVAEFIHFSFKWTFLIRKITRYYVFHLLIYNRLQCWSLFTISSFLSFVRNFVPFIRMLLMWSFHNFNCIFVHCIRFFFFSFSISVHWTLDSGEWSGFFFSAIFSHSFIPSNDSIQFKIRMGNVHLHFTRRCYLIQVLLSLFVLFFWFFFYFISFALWYVSIPCALLRASSVEWLR